MNHFGVMTEKYMKCHLMKNPSHVIHQRHWQWWRREWWRMLLMNQTVENTPRESCSTSHVRVVIVLMAPHVRALMNESIGNALLHWFAHLFFEHRTHFTFTFWWCTEGRCDNACVLSYTFLDLFIEIPDNRSVRVKFGQSVPIRRRSYGMSAMLT